MVQSARFEPTPEWVQIKLFSLSCAAFDLNRKCKVGEWLCSCHSYDRKMFSLGALLCWGKWLSITVAHQVSVTAYWPPPNSFCCVSWSLPCVCYLLSHVQLFATLWTVAHQAPLSMEFFKQEHWSGLPFPSSGDLPDPGIKLRSPALQVDSLLSETPGKPCLFLAAAAAKSLQPCPTLCDPIDSSPPGSAVPGILQARTLGWVAISFSSLFLKYW